MPLKAGTSEKTVRKNIAEFAKGKTFRHTEEKFGRHRAIKQAVAVAKKKQRESGKAY